MTGQLASIFSTSGILIGTILPFLVVLTVVVFIHEMGHYLVGRWCGIGVKAFSVGFGPEIFGFNDRRGTRWKLSAVPLGGYVKFVGDMNATSTPTPEGEESLTESERAVAFHTQAVWKRAATVAAGPLANFLLTIVVFSVLFATYGRVVFEPVVAEVQAGSPAERGGFQPGDRFVTVNGHKVETFGDVQYYTQALGGDEVTFGILRDGAELTLKATPELKEQKDASGGTVRVAIIGVVNNKAMGQPRVIAYSPGAAVLEGVKETASVLARTGQFLKRFAAGREDKCQLGGPIKIAKMSGQAAKDGLSRLVELMALLSVGIGFLNLLPIPPLDGGHLAFYAIEAVLRRPVTERVMEAVYRVGLFAVLAFMAFVFWNDLFGC